MEDQLLDLDTISRLPGSIIDIILTLMPIRDAVTTSILSTKWRYKWANITKLVFDGNLIQRSVISNELSTRHEFISVIHQVLLLHRGPILEFTLDYFQVGTCINIDHIILHLSRNKTLKKLTLNAYEYELPSSIYSLQQLTHLALNNCKIQLPSTFNGFSMLTRLCLNWINITGKMLLSLVSGCPRLKSLALVNFNVCVFQKESSFPQLFEFLPVVEQLHLSFYILQGCKAPLQNISTVFLELGDDTNVWLDHLTKFQFEDFENDKREWEILKLVLIKSPMLKKVCIKLSDTVTSDEKLKMFKIFKRLPRASPVVEIIVEEREDPTRFLGLAVS